MPAFLKHIDSDRAPLGWAGRCVDIGLVNNMPDSALEATERQFLALLDAASDGVLVRLSLYSLPDVCRNEAGKRRISRFYSGLEGLWDSKLDGLIVTGAEPRTQNLIDEPYWHSLTQVLDWANENTQSTVCSCLAAHAAVLHSDGIGRRKSSEKTFGVMGCTQVSDHPLIAGVTSRLKMPHSRWNGLPEEDLLACGYSVLTRTQDAGVDAFVKRRNSLFVFFQGHPEYASDSLLLEYRRDIVRYTKGEMDRYPSVPRNYFDKAVADTLTIIGQEVAAGHCENLVARVAAAVGQPNITNTWSSTATRLYQNWLAYLSARKRRRATSVKVPATARGLAFG